jgi:hypothetical protein
MRAPNLPVLFHPDCNRRLRNHTESADPADCSAGARGLWRSLAITAGGDFHPAPRTRSDRNPTNPINAPLATLCNDFHRLCTGCPLFFQREANGTHTHQKAQRRLWMIGRPHYPGKIIAIW